MLIFFRTFGLVILAVTSSPRQADEAPSKASVTARVTCGEHTAKPRQPFRCEVFLLADSEGGTALVPRLLTPFAVPTRPPALIQFFARSGEREEELRIAPEALRGRYDLAPLTVGDLSTLRPGTLVGWSFDLNGQDWLLPDPSGPYLLRAKITLKLQAQDGRWPGAVLDALGVYKKHADSIVVNGTFWTNGELITVER